MPTPKLTRAVAAAVEKQAPPKRGQFRPKLPTRTRRHQPAADHHPRQCLDGVPESYRAISRDSCATRFKLHGTPMRVGKFRTGRNPYVKSTEEKRARRRAGRRARG